MEPLKMIFRWFAQGYDNISLEQIRQIAGMTGVATSLLKYPVGEVWPLADLEQVRDQVNGAGLTMEVIESVNIHEDIKLGRPTRDSYIDKYIKTMEHLSAVGVKVLCYNFMPVLDWARSDLYYPLPDGSTALAYIHQEVVKQNPANLADSVGSQSRGYELPGWEPERLKEMSSLMAAYEGMSQEQYWDNVKYFLDAVVPHAQRLDVKLAIHPDDPPWDLYGLPRLMTCRDNIRKFLDLNKSEYNGLTLCTGSLGANRANDLPAMIREFGGEGRIHFAHVRNLLYIGELDFHESAHLSSAGSLDLYEIMRAFCDVGYQGYVRPDHGRAIWNDQGRAGYGLYDRALGSQYLLGLWEAIGKENR